MADIICRNSILFDGSGKSPIIADVAITDGKITAIGSQLDGIHGATEIDCRIYGLCRIAGYSYTS